MNRVVVAAGWYTVIQTEGVQTQIYCYRHSAASMEEGAGPLKTDDKPDYSQTISWKNLSSEIRQSVFTWGNFFTVLTIGLLPSLFDFGTDYLQAVNFLWGSNYTKQVVNQTDLGNCSHIGRYTSFAGQTPESL